LIHTQDSCISIIKMIVLLRNPYHRDNLYTADFALVLVSLDTRICYRKSSCSNTRFCVSLYRYVTKTKPRWGLVWRFSPCIQESW